MGQGSHVRSQQKDFTQPSSGDRELTNTAQGTRVCTRVNSHDENHHISPNTHLTKAPLHKVAETEDLIAAHTSNTVFAGRITLPIELQSNDQGPLGPSHCVGGISYTSHSNPQQIIPPYNPHFSDREQALLKEELKILFDKASNSESISLSEGVLLQHVQVPKKDGGQRPVINVKALNSYVHYKMEGLHAVKALLQKRDWMAKIDLKDVFL